MIRITNIASIALRMLLYYWKSYILITLQIAAGAFVVFSSLTIYFSIESRYKEMQNEVHDLTWYIVAQSSDDSDTLPITYEQFMQLKSSYKEAKFPLHFVYPVYYSNEENELVQAYFIYVSDDYMELTYQSEENFETSPHVYMGAEIKKFMERNGQFLNVIPNTPSHRMIDESLVIGEEAHYPIIPIAKVTNNKTDSFEVSIHFGENVKMALTENIVLLPLNALYESHIPKVEMALRLPVQVNPTVSGEDATVLIMKVISQLFSWNQAYSYNVSTPLQQFLLKMTSVKDTAVIVFVIAMVCLLLVILGLTGLIHLLFNRRKQGLSILIATGARRQDLWVSMVLESMYPALIGVGIGILGGYYYLPTFVKLEQIVISPSAMGTIYTAVVCLLPVFLSSSTLLLRIYSMQPINILSRE